MARADWAKRSAFARYYPATGNATQSALHAGVPKASAHSMGDRWLRDADVVALIRGELDAEVRALGPLAVSVMREILASDQVAPQTRLQAARDLLDRLGWLPPKRREAVPAPNEVPLFEMSLDELEAYVSGQKGVRLDTPSLLQIAQQE